MNWSVCVLLLALPPAAAPQAELLTASGEWVRGQARIAGGSVTVGQVKLALEQVVSLRFPGTARADWLEQGVVLSSGGVLAGTVESLQGGILRVVSEQLGGLSLRKEAVAAVALLPRRSLELPQSGEGALLANGDFLSGPVEWINSETVGVESGKRIVQVPRERVATVRFGGASGAGREFPAARARQFVSLSSGESLSGVVRELDGSTLAMEMEPVGLVRLPVAAVVEIRSEGGPLVPLSAIAPAAARQVPQFDEFFPHRLDRSVAGGLLRVAGVTYERGIGCHPRCELEYDLGRAYSALVAEIGIDDAAPGRGAAVFRALADGRQVFESGLVRRGESARTVKVSLSGASRLTLVVDFGPDGVSFGGHADWCRAVLVR